MGSVRTPALKRGHRVTFYAWLSAEIAARRTSLQVSRAVQRWAFSGRLYNAIPLPHRGIHCHR